MVIILKYQQIRKKWDRIIDHSSFECHSMQNLYFPSKPVKYVKIVGISSFIKFFRVGTFEAYYRENIPEMRNGIVVPKEKVQYLNYWRANDYVIRLTQPYYIGSMRFYIDGGNSKRKYKFFIETSLNQRDWDEVAYKRDEFVSGWQTFRFTLKPILHIRITRTASSDGALSGLWIANFRCPSSV